MRLAIGALIYDPEGHGEAEVDQVNSRVRDITRRSTRTPTLDGGASLIDFGASDADRDITVVMADQPVAVVDLLQRVFETHSVVLLFLPDGAFRAHPKSFSEVNGRIVMIFNLLGVAEVRL